MIVTLGLLLFAQTGIGQVAKELVFKGQIDASFVPQRSPHYEPELTLDVCINEQAWQNQQGLHATFGSTDQLYFRKEVPDGQELKTGFTAVCWKGERVNTQVLLWSADETHQIRLSAGDLMSAEGNKIPAGSITFEMVRYVLSNYPYAEKLAVCGESSYKNGFLMPDRFEDFERFDLPAQTTRPVWMSIDVPGGTVPGIYTGEVQVKAKGHTSVLPLKIEVQNQLLPQPKEWGYRLDLWQNPWAVAWYNDVEPWSDEHKLLLKKHLKHYAEAGGKYITTYGVHSPWSDNSYWIEGGMIDWIKKTDGSWHFDYTVFDEYVKLAMECGIDKAITIYTPVPWGYRFRYTNEQTGDYEYQSWAPDSEAFKAAWNVFLTDLKLHLQDKGWLGITYLGINENPLDQTLAAINVIKSHDKNWRITYAGNWHPELDLLLDDYSFLYGNEPSLAEQKARSARGNASSTVYVCCNPPVPNNFVFSPPIEGRWISWYAMAYGYDGFLRWAYDAWPEDTKRDARHGTWAAGDCYMVYPGGKSCIRFEKMREGIVDFEKISILKAKADKSTNVQVKSLLKQLDNHMKVFVSEKDFDEHKISADVREGNRIVRELSDLLSN